MSLPIAAEPGTDARARGAPSLRVAIAGLGPKGLYALERLLDHAADLGPGVRIAVDLFEPHPSPGAGPVYDPAQPEFLRMNFAAGQLDMWWPSSRAVPPAERPSFVAWSGDDGDSYPPRAEVGRYLCEGFATLRRHAPPNVDIRLRREAVEAAGPDGDGGWVLRAGGRECSCDELLIAVGHGRSGLPVRA